VNNDIDIAGIKIPDSKMARDLTQLIRDTEPDLLFHHSASHHTGTESILKRSGSVNSLHVTGVPQQAIQERGLLCHFT
jgi:hypothetical protein